MGLSVHNQRIERFWCDLKKEVIYFYITVFSFLAREHGVDFTLDSHIFCVHYLFIPRINADLALFQQSWNNHALSTEGNRTPRQLEFLNRHLSAARVVDDVVLDLENYGVEGNEDDEQFYRQQDEGHGRPRIIAIANPLSLAGFQYFSNKVRPLTMDDNDASLYIQHIVYALKQFDVAKLL